MQSLFQPQRAAAVPLAGAGAQRAAAAGSGQKGRGAGQMALDFVLADDCCPTGGGADERRNGRGLVPTAVLAGADCELAVFACRRRDSFENFRGGVKLPHSRYLPDRGRCCQFCGAAFYRRGHGKRLAAAGPVASDSGVPGGAVPLLHGARGGFVQGRRHAC